MKPVLVVLIVAVSALGFNGKHEGEELFKDTTDQDSFRVYLGPELGFNLTGVWGSDIPNDARMLAGALGGAGVHIRFNRHFTLAPGVYWNMKGFSSESLLDTVNDLTSYHAFQRLSYVEVPILAKLVFGRGEFLKGFFCLGPSVGVLVTAYIKGNTEGATKIHYNKDLVEDSPGLFIDPFMVDPALSGGCGVHVYLGKGYIVAQARGTLGLLPVDEGDEAIRNWSGTLSLGYVFELKREEELW
jgi:hypothetical protein